MKPTRRDIQQALKVAQSSSLRFRANQSLAALSGRGFGHVTNDEFRISRGERRRLKQWLSQQGITWQTPWSTFDGDRLQTAEAAINEKLAKAGATESRILVATWGGGPLINKQRVPDWEGGYVSATTASLSAIECDCVLIVENFAAFTALHKVTGDLGRKRILAVYRGDPERSSGLSWARDIAGRAGIPLVAYVDFDPAGLAIALQVGAEAVLLPRLSALDTVQGSGEDFTNQHIQWEQLKKMAVGPDLQPYITEMETRRQGFTQERMIGLKVPHQWVELNGGLPLG